MLTTQEQIEKGRKVFDSQVFAIPYAGDKYVELATSLIHTIREEDKAEMVKGLQLIVDEKHVTDEWRVEELKSFINLLGITKE